MNSISISEIEKEIYNQGNAGNNIICIIADPICDTQLWAESMYLRGLGWASGMTIFTLLGYPYEVIDGLPNNSFRVITRPRTLNIYTNPSPEASI